DASVTLSGTAANFAAVGSLADNAGNFTVSGGRQFTTAGDLSNTGTVTIGPGSAVTVHGAYSQGAAGTLDVQLGGPGTGQFGVLTATSSAALDGTLQAELVNGYNPSVGDSFQVMSFPGHSDNFASFDLPH